MNDISQVISLLKRHTKIIGNQFIISGYQHQSIWSSGVLEEVSYLLLIAYVNLMQSDGIDTHKRVLIDKVVDEWAGIITGILNHQNTPQNKMMIKQRLNEKSIKYTPIIDQMLGKRLDNNPDDEVFYKYELYELFIEEIKDNFNTRFCQRPEDGLAGAMDFINLSEDNNIICQEVFDERSVVMLSLKYDDVDEINEHDKIAITKNQNKKDIRKRALVIRDGVVNFLTECAYQVTQKGGNSKENFYDNDDIQDEDGKNKGSQLGLFFMPAIMTSLLSKLLFSAGIIFGFIATLLTFGVCSGCYSYTYEKVQSNKFIKEFFAILSGIFGCILWVVFLFFIADIFDYKQSSHNVKSNTTSQSVLNDQNTQNVNISPNNIQTANTNNEPPLNPQLILAEAQKRYEKSVTNINAVWNSLHPSTQDFLRDEQRAINKQREADCTAYGNAQSNDKDLAKAYRYLCEVLQLNERAEYLKTQLNTVVTPPEPMIEAQPLPETGATNKPNLYGDSPLQIKTNPGSHYWVKIVNAYNEQEEVVSYFIRGGETLDVNLPTGSYVVKYAYGDTWYGEEHLFGENTGYSKADEVFEFYHNQGYVIELIQQLNGNLHTTAIDESQF